MNNKRVKIEVFLDQASIEALEAYAAKQGSTRSGAARSIIMKGLSDLKVTESKDHE